MLLPKDEHELALLETPRLTLPLDLLQAAPEEAFSGLGKLPPDESLLRAAEDLLRLLQ